MTALDPTPSPADTNSADPGTRRALGVRELWPLIAEREVRSRMRDKTFLAATGFTLAILVGLFVLMGFLGARADEYRLSLGPGIPAETAASVESVLRATGSEDAVVEAESAGSVAEVEAAVGDDADAGVLLEPGQVVLVGDTDLDPLLQSALTAVVTEARTQTNAAKLGVDLEALREGTVPQVRLLDPADPLADERGGVAFAFVVIFLVTALSFGMSIAQSVVQEKESRVVEILAAAVPIRALLWGKIAGNTLLALGQVVLLAVVGVAGLLATGRRDLLAGVGWSIVGYVLFFLLGFLALACVWSVAGSLAARNQDLQSTTLPGQVILLVPYLAAVIGGEGLRTVLSMVPIASTMIMPGRLAEGDVPWWQVLVAIVLTLATAVVLVRLGARLYERTLLRTERRQTYREALSMLRRPA